MTESELYTFIGCSQTERFDGAVYQPEHGPLVVGKARWQPWARAYEVFRDGRFDEYMTRTFVELRAIRRSEVPNDRPFTPVLIYPVYQQPVLFHFQPRETHVDRVICFEYGEPDAFDLALECQGKVTFDVPGYEFPALFPNDEPDAETVDVSIMIERVRERAQPLFQGLRALKEFGFPNVFLHEIAPVAPQGPPGFTSARLRQKFSLLFNREFERFSAASGIRMVRIWDAVTVNGIRDERYTRDPLHLNRRAATFSLRQIHEYVHGRAPSA